MDAIAILDFGSQYTQLIARRIREANVYSEIFPYSVSYGKLKDFNPKGLVLSGGPMSVYDEGVPQLDEKIFDLGIPILGICYGMQLLAKVFGGRIEPAKNREYGKANVEILDYSEILKDVRNNSIVWMSHGDLITKAPEGFEINAFTENTPVAAMSNKVGKIYGVQFHPEVKHTAEGQKIINNFLFDICQCRASWTPDNFIEKTIPEIKKKVGNSKAILALSGGVDSSVAAALIDKAIGENLFCVHVDNGLMRKDESRQVLEVFKEKMNLNLTFVDASEVFLSRLKGVTEPEKKRKIIGSTFIEIFEKEALKIKDAEFLVQGTLYPDVIESVPVKGTSVTIKSHHNVGGLPEKMNLKLIEPFRELFKDEVREIGRKLGLPDEFIRRHPFPGPGLAVRILGEVTPERLRILREADEIFIREIKNFGIYDEIWQAFSVLLPVQTVGVMGDFRTYENVVALRAVTSADGMTADWYRMDGEILAEISNKIIQNVKGINRVVYDVSSKPPATIEWE
jgi:GMP synthase (glutamine-hydrolysing)